MDNCLVSIIVPVYNAEKYLTDCLDSICTQTYSNIEIIAVNDGSTDHSAQILEQYAYNDIRIKILSQDNSGSAAARKAGIDAASGQYILMVDSDDWIDRDTVDICLKCATRTKADCVMFGYVREYMNFSKKTPLFDHTFYWNATDAEVYVHRRLIGPLGTELYMPEKVDSLVSVCMKLYRTDIARKGRTVSNREIGTSEDTIFNLYALENCTISYINRCFYHYRKYNSHSITSHYKADLSYKWDQLYQIFQEYINTSGKAADYMPAFFNRVACCTIGLGLNEISSGYNLIKQARQLKNILSKPLYQQAFSQLDIKPCPFKWKLFFILCKLKLSFFLAILLHIINYLRSRAPY